MAYAHIPDVKRQKIHKKAEKLRFVGYSKKSKGYRLFNEDTRKIVTRRDVIFNETDFGHSGIKAETEAITPKEIVEVDPNPDKACRPEVEHRRSELQRNAPVRYGFDEYADTVISEHHVHHVAYNVCQITEPRTMEEALASNQAKEWKAAADSEYESLMENQTWELMELPHGRKPVGCKWVFKVKCRNDGRVERFKGRLVAKGYVLKYGLEELYMQQPDGYIKPGEEHLVCKLKKSIYGLKQAFQEYMNSIGFNQSGADPCVYIRTASTMTIVAVYVDDLILITKTVEEMQEVKKSLAAQFKMKNMGELHYCLGVSIEQDKDRKCLWMHQKQYIQNMLEKHELTEAKTVSTPADPSIKFEKDDGVSKGVDQTTYQSIVGSLLYAAIATRPDIAQAVGVVSKFNSKPTEAHLTAVKRILRYLKGTADQALKYEKSEDGSRLPSRWSAGDLDERHSMTGNLFLMAGGPISWASKKQATVALSTSEAEYVALSSATQEAIWLRRLLTDLGAVPNGPTMMEDNQGAIAIARNPVAHARTKHINIRYHFVREAVQEGTVDLRYCPTNVMLADLLTKSLPRGRFENLRLAMGMDRQTMTAQPVN